MVWIRPLDGTGPRECMHRHVFDYCVSARVCQAHKHSLLLHSSSSFGISVSLFLLLPLSLSPCFGHTRAMEETTHHCPATPSVASPRRTNEDCDQRQSPTPVFGETQQHQRQVQQRPGDHHVQRDQAGLGGGEGGPALPCAGHAEKGDSDKHDARPTMHSHKKKMTENVSTKSDGERLSSEKVEGGPATAGDSSPRTCDNQTKENEEGEELEEGEIWEGSRGRGNCEGGVGAILDEVSVEEVSFPVSVGNVSDATTSEELRVAFGHLGPHSFHMVNHPRGCYGVFRFKEKCRAEEAIDEMGGLLIQGRHIMVCAGESGTDVPLVLGKGGLDRWPPVPPVPTRRWGNQDTVLVHNIAWKTAEDDLLDEFKKRLPVEVVLSAKLATHVGGRRFGCPKGWGRVKLSSPLSAQAAVTLLDSVELHGHVLRVELSDTSTTPSLPT
ncbi:unnamed protein product [Ectocarpus fasciculatus]